VDHPDSIEISDITDALVLCRRLVSGAVGRPLPPAVAVDAFQRLHRGGESGAFDSALLLCTDWRWRRVSAQVIAGIVETGILDDDDQDRLADMLLWQDRVRYRHPIWWIATGFVEYQLGSPEPGRTVRVDPDTPSTAERTVWPPLRTWAACRVLGRRRASVNDVVEHARSLPARDAAAVVTGAVRVADDLDDDQARTVLNVASTWGHKTPRLAALKRLLAGGDDELVQTLAANDPDGSIRQWVADQLDSKPSQGSLFD